MKKTVGYAFKVTLPVLFGYLVLGAAFGLMIQKAGYNFWWAILSSVLIYAGSGQFVLVDLLTNGASLITVALTTLSVNSRHIFYGLTFIEKFKKMGKLRPYMIFSLTDETYSLLYSVKTPIDVDEKWLYFFIALFDHSYWIMGGAIGAILGQVLPINTQGVEFSMTALFLVIFIDQWREKGNRLPALIGLGCGIVSLIIFKADKFLLPALIATVVLLVMLENPVQRHLYPIVKEDKNAD